MGRAQQARWGLAAAGLLCTMILALWVLRVAAPDRQSIRIDFGRKLEELECASAWDPELGDRLAEDLLEVAIYREEARALYLKLERRHAALHTLDQLARAARKEVPPFLERSKDLSRRSHSELDALLDEGRSLFGKYGATRFAAELRQSLGALENRLAAQSTLVSEEFLKLSAAVRKSSDGSAFSAALRLLETFKSSFQDHAEMRSQLETLQAMVLRKATAECTRLIARARREPLVSQGGAAVRSLESALPNYMGLPEHAQIESVIRELLPR